MIVKVNISMPVRLFINTFLKCFLVYDPNTAQIFFLKKNLEREASLDMTGYSSTYLFLTQGTGFTSTQDIPGRSRSLKTELTPTVI